MRLAAWILLGAQAVAAPPSPWADVEVPPRPAAFETLAGAGERLYGWHCLPCHGPEGKGDGPSAARLGLRPRDFTRGLFKLKTSPAGEGPFDDDLYRTLSVGLPARFMPGFREALAPEDRWALVAFLRTLAPGVEPPRTRIAPRPAGDAARGGRLFAACAPCHGAEGKGDGPAAAGLRDREGRPAALPDLGRGEVEFLAGARAEDVYRVLTTGLEGSPMPSFAALPEQDRRDLAAFVASRYRPVPAGERAFFAKGCIACHTIGKGRHLGPDLAGVGRRRSGDWLRRWLRGPERLAAVDADARALVREYGAVMPDPNLAEPDVESVARFLEGLRP